MLEIQQLECTRGDHVLFSNLNFSLREGEILHVRGSNGSGKTSLLRMVCGLFLQSQGQVLWDGQNIRKLREEYTRQVTYLGHLNGIKGDLSALENLRLGGKLDGLQISENDALQALAKMGLRGREDLSTKVLSQGQKRRVALARLLLSKTKLWILDEPFVALDVKAVAHLQSVIQQHLERQGMVVFTTHQEVEINTGRAHHIDLDL